MKKMKYELIVEYIETHSKPFMTNDIRWSLGLPSGTVHTYVSILMKEGFLKILGQSKVGRSFLYDKTDAWCVEKAKSAIKQSLFLKSQKYKSEAWIGMDKRCKK